MPPITRSQRGPAARRLPTRSPGSRRRWRRPRRRRPAPPASAGCRECEHAERERQDPAEDEHPPVLGSECCQHVSPSFETRTMGGRPPPSSRRAHVPESDGVVGRSVRSGYLRATLGRGRGRRFCQMTGSVERECPSDDLRHRCEAVSGGRRGAGAGGDTELRVHAVEVRADRPMT